MEVGGCTVVVGRSIARIIIGDREEEEAVPVEGLGTMPFLGGSSNRLVGGCMVRWVMRGTAEVPVRLILSHLVCILFA